VILPNGLLQTVPTGCILLSFCYLRVARLTLIIPRFNLKEIVVAPVRVAVIGLGQRGLQHLGALWQLQAEGEVVFEGYGDHREENRATEKLRQFIPEFDPTGIGSFATFDELMQSSQPDALHLCIPPGFHAGEVVRAAQAGVHLFVEKPMSLFFDEAIEMETAIGAAGVVAAAGFQRRYEPSAEAAHQFLHDRRMVMVTMVSEGTLEAHSVKHSATAAGGGPADKVWAKNRAWSGASVVEAGIHQTDLMRYWCGDIAWVQSAYVPRHADDIEDGGDNPYAYTVTYGFQSGAVGNLLMSRLRKVYHHASYQIAMWDHGHLTFEQEGLVAYFYDGPYPPQNPPNTEQIRHPLPTAEARDSTLAINRDFIGAVRAGADAAPAADLRCSFASSMNSLAAVLAANASHDLDGERIELTAFADDEQYARFRKRDAQMS